jgi:CAAX protease family protein
MKERWDSPPDEQEHPSAAANNQPIVPESTPTTEPDRPNWTYRDTVFGSLLTLVPWLAVASLELLQSSSLQTAASQPLSRAADIQTAVVSFIISALVEGTFLIAPLWFAIFKPRRLARQQGLPEPSVREGLRALGMRASQPAQALAAFVLGALAIFIASFLYSVIAQALGVTVTTNVDQLEARAGIEPWTTLAIIIGAVVVAPFCEEIFFRGYFFQGLRLRFSLWLAVPLSAVIFGLAHGDLGSLVLLIIIGLVLAILRWRTRSLWPGMALHMFNNFLGAWLIFQAIHF